MVMFQICSLLRGGIAERGGVRVGHRIIEINGSSVVAVPHEKIVNMLATSVGEVSICLNTRWLQVLTEATRWPRVDTATGWRHNIQITPTDAEA